MPPKETKPKTKWSSKCKAYAILKEGLQSGSIDSGMRPKDVYESDAEFMKYPLTSFRSALNRMKAELGCHVRDEGKLHLLLLVDVLAVNEWHWFTACFYSILVAGKFVKGEDEDEDDGLLSDDDDTNPPAKKSKWGSTVTPQGTSRAIFNVHPSLQVKRHFVMSEWVTKDLQDMVTVTIPLTSGVDITDDDDIKVYVSENNTELIVEEKVIKMIADVNEMHQGFRKKDPTAYPANNPTILVFNKFLKDVRKREGDAIYMTGVILFHFLFRRGLSTITGCSPRTEEGRFMWICVPCTTMIMQRQSTTPCSLSIEC